PPTPPPHTSPLPLHDALPIFRCPPRNQNREPARRGQAAAEPSPVVRCRGRGRADAPRAHGARVPARDLVRRGFLVLPVHGAAPGDRKSTRLNSSHQIISYAVF